MPLLYSSQPTTPISKHAGGNANSAFGGREGKAGISASGRVESSATRYLSELKAL